MKKINNLSVVVMLCILLLVRLIVQGTWIASVQVGSVFVAWYDIVYEVRSKIKSKKWVLSSTKTRFAIVFSILILIGIGLLILTVLNLIFGFKWLNLPIVMDELTIIALLLCFAQEIIVNLVVRMITEGE